MGRECDMNPLLEFRNRKSESGILLLQIVGRGRRLNLCLLFFVFCLLLFSVGCGNKFFDPVQIGRFRPVPAVNVILDSLGVAEETPSVWEGAEEPKPIDVVAYETDYMFKPGDFVRISIFELLQDGVHL